MKQKMYERMVKHYCNWVDGFISRLQYLMKIDDVYLFWVQYADANEIDEMKQIYDDFKCHARL